MTDEKRQRYATGKNASKPVRRVFDIQFSVVNISSRISQEEAFDTVSGDEYYKPIDSYEGAHRYDPKFQWDRQDEKKLVRTVRRSARDIQ